MIDYYRNKIFIKERTLPMKEKTPSDMSKSDKNNNKKEKKTVPYQEMIGGMEVTVVSDVNIECENETEDLIYSNLGLFLKNYELIINNQQYSGIKLPNPIFGMMYAGSGMGRATLGRLLSILEHEEGFNSICPYCGGRACMVSSGGSPLSGIVYSAKYICTADGCKKVLRFKHGWTYREKIVKLKKDPECVMQCPPHHVLELSDIIRKYESTNCDNPADVTSLIQLLQESTEEE
jgi:hypothetical protein